MGRNVFPKLFSIGDFFLPSYGALVAAGVLAGLLVSTRLARRRGMDTEKLTNLVLYVVFAGLLGAKLAMFLFDWEYYAQRPGEIFSLATLQAAGAAWACCSQSRQRAARKSSPASLLSPKRSASLVP